MRMFGFGRSERIRGSKIENDGDLSPSAPLMPESKITKPVSRKTGRTEVFAVRVGKSFKSEILRLLAELQLERHNAGNHGRRVTEGEIMELMLEAYKAARRNGDAAGHAVPLADDVWCGAHEISRHMGISPSEVIERLVVQKIAELGLFARV